MTDAGGTTTLKQLSNVGEYVLWEIRNDSVDNGETIPFDGPSNSPVKAEDRVRIISAENVDDESSIADGTINIAYDETAMHFTVTDAGASSNEVVITFYHIPQ